MVEKKFLISKNYIEVPVVLESKPMTLEVLQLDKDGNSQSKICEFQVPIGMYQYEDGTGEFKPDYFARFSVKEYIGQTLILKGSGKKVVSDSIREAFFDKIRQVDSEFGETDFDFASEGKPRPKYHFTSAKGWINDPNGLVYRDGVYHLYFQYNPFNTQWENMCWGHAVSRDLVHWQQQETVMYPDENGYMFSGSGFVNKNGCLGLPKDALMFYYTAAGECRPWTAERLSTQRLAYSIDGGKTLIKTDKGVVPTISHENRDPKVFWHDKTKAYIMILWVDGNEFAILRSENLEKWKISQRFELEKGFECPDLICLYASDEDRTGGDSVDVYRESNRNNKKEHWFVTTADGYYYPGEFDGYSFKWNGKRHCMYMNDVPYAAQTYSNTDGRTILVPWLRVKFPGRKYTGAMGIPRELGLVSTDLLKKAGVLQDNVAVEENDKYRISLKPVREIRDDYEAQSFKVRGMNIFVDNGIVEVTADCDTILGVYEV